MRWSMHGHLRRPSPRATWRRQVRLKIGIVSSAVRHMMADTGIVLVSVVSGKYAMINC
ncbi:MAG: hypothetical protein M2R45_02585 [Verrucomicrobia subdivision 3 bacterium]|nr:hypothetical protein [Limisphaerales bacterium]MCS1416445.1 hypothetical protein [Limisphaerales bacterium]